MQTMGKTMITNHTQHNHPSPNNYQRGILYSTSLKRNFPATPQNPKPKTPATTNTKQVIHQNNGENNSKTNTQPTHPNPNNFQRGIRYATLKVNDGDVKYTCELYAYLLMFNDALACGPRSVFNWSHAAKSFLCWVIIASTLSSTKRSAPRSGQFLTIA